MSELMSSVFVDSILAVFVVFFMRGMNHTSIWFVFLSVWLLDSTVMAVPTMN